MKVSTNGSGEVLLAMTYPEAELLQQIVEMSATGAGGHRGADYVNIRLSLALNKVLPLSIDEVEKQVEEEAKETRRARPGRR